MSKTTLTHLVSLLLVVVMLLGLPSLTFAARAPIVYVNGVQLTIESKLINDRTMVPLRAIFEALGYDVDYDSTTNTAIAGKRPANLAPANSEGIINIVVNGEIVNSDVLPFVEDGTTYVPVRFVSETAGFPVEWDEIANCVYIGSEQAVNYKAEFLTSSNVSHYHTQLDDYIVYYDTANYKFIALSMLTGETLEISTTSESVNVEGVFYDNYLRNFSILYSTRLLNAISPSYYIYNSDETVVSYEQLGFTNTDSSDVMGNKVYGILSSGNYLIYDFDHLYNIPGGKNSNAGYYIVDRVTYERTKLNIKQIRYYNRKEEFYEFNGDLYYFREESPEWYHWELYKYDLVEHTETKIYTMSNGGDDSTSAPRIVNGKIYKFTKSGNFEVYSLSGELLRTIAVDYQANNISIEKSIESFRMRLYELSNGDIVFYDTFKVPEQIARQLPSLVAGKDTFGWSDGMARIDCFVKISSSN